MGISTHVLDTARGRPAVDVAITLERENGGAWAPVSEARTDADGRVPGLLPAGRAAEAGIWRLRFEVGDYFERRGEPAFYPSIEVVFRIAEAGGHYHLPLLVSPFGYSTYRGS